MMRLSFITLLILAGIIAQGQPDYSGVYGYTSAPADSSAGKNEMGRAVSLTLIRVEGTKYRFWLDVNRGWPSYASGATDGVITFKNDTASFDNTFETANKPCILHFRIKGTTISIDCDAHSADCGFGNGVTANDEYPRFGKQPALNNAWLKEQYDQSPSATIIADRADVYEDEDGLHKKSQYFVKGDTIISIAESKNTIYTEYITPQGKFVYGWLRKSALQVKQ